MSFTEELVFWVITSVFTLVMTMLGILFKRNLSAQTLQANAVNELTKNVAILSENMRNFQTNCQAVINKTDHRVEVHGKEIDHLNEKATRHGVTLEHHEKRITHLETK